MSDNACCVWDLTVPMDNCNSDELKAFFAEHCKKWCFQGEEGEETGYKHWQCRISLKTKIRKNQVLDLMSELKGHVSRTSSANQKNDFYVMKEDTRISGPYRDTDLYVPWQYRNDVVWYPWQEKVISIMGLIPSRRRIHIIVDRAGASGKSFLACWHGCRGLARVIPPLNDYKDLMRMMCDVPNTHCLFVDIPRALDKKNLRGFFGAMETIKSGYAFDERYSFKEKWFDTPHIFVFSNKYPDMNLLTMDRWVIWDMDFKMKDINRLTFHEMINKSHEDNELEQE